MDKHIIAIVTYNRLALLKQCLKAVLSQTRPFDGIVIVDNASTDGTGEYLKQWKRTEWGSCSDGPCVLVKARQNSGGAGGFSKAVERAMKLDPDWVTLIDDDAILRENYLEMICEGIRSAASGYQAFSGVPMTDGVRPGHRRRVQGLLIKREVPVPEKEYERPYFMCDIASFVGLTVSAEAIRKAGLPDPRFFIWYDDTEYCLRLTRDGKILNCNKAVIDHRVSSGSGNESVSWKDYYGIRNRLYMALCHYNRLTAYAIAFKKAGNGLAQSLSCLLNGKKQEAFKVFSLYYHAITDGLAGRLGRSGRYAP